MKTSSFFRKSLLGLVMFVTMMMTSFSSKAQITLDAYLDTMQNIGQIYNFCSSNVDSIVLHAPADALGGIQWINDAGVFATGVNQVTITHANQGRVTFMANEPGTFRSIYIYIFTGSPVHQIDNHVFHICGFNPAMVSVVFGSEVSSSLWSTGQGGTDVQFTQPGTYWVDLMNSCATVRDSFNVDQPAYYVENLGPDTTFCNSAVSLQLQVHLEGTTPWDSLLWSTGATSTSITVTQPGTYSLFMQSGCMSWTVYRTIYQQTFPLPNLGPNLRLCGGDSVVLDPNPGFVHQTYYWSDASTDTTLTVHQTGDYAVTISNGACAPVSDTVHVFFQNVIQTEKICIATVDAVTGHNKVVFEPTQNVGTDHFNVYKLNAGYDLIGSVPVGNNTALVFNDLVTNPMTSAARYKIAAVDSCGNESNLSFYHSTTKINSNSSTGGGVDLTVTDPYEDESGQYVPTFYYIFIDSLNNGSLHLMDSVNAVFNSYTVTNPFLGATYVMGVKMPWACANGSKSLNLSQVSLSNKSSVITEVEAKSSAPISVKIFPNPSSNGIFRVEGAGITKIEITDLLGHTIMTTTSNNINLGIYSAGMYIANITSKYGSTSKILTIQ